MTSASPTFAVVMISPELSLKISFEGKSKCDVYYQEFVNICYEFLSICLNTENSDQVGFNFELSNLIRDRRKFNFFTWKRALHRMKSTDKVSPSSAKIRSKSESGLSGIYCSPHDEVESHELLSSDLFVILDIRYIYLIRQPGCIPSFKLYTVALLGIRIHVLLFLNAFILLFHR